MDRSEIPNIFFHIPVKQVTGDLRVRKIVKFCHLFLVILSNHVFGLLYLVKLHSQILSSFSVILTSLANIACLANCSKFSSPKSWLAYLISQHLFEKVRKMRRFWNLESTNWKNWRFLWLINNEASLAIRVCVQGWQRNLGINVAN